MNTSLLTSSSTRKECPYCGQRYDTGTPFSAATHKFHRFKIYDDTYIETCEKELGEFIGRSLHSRYVDEDGNPK